MKKLWILLLGISLQASAQKQSPVFTNQSENNVKLLKWANRINPQLLKTTGIEYRPIEIISMGNDGKMYDSTRLSYTGVRGAEFDYVGMYYQIYGMDPLSTPNASFPLIIVDRDFMDFDQADIYLNDTATNIKSLTETIKQIFNANGRVEKNYTQTSSPTDLSRLVYEYGPNNLLKICYGIDISGAISDTFQKKHLYYNAQNQLTHDTVFTDYGSGMMPEGVEIYNYNPQGLVTRMEHLDISVPSAVDSYAFINTYNSNNALTKVAYVYTSNGGNILLMDNISYLPDGVSISSIEFLADQGGGLQENVKVDYHYGAAAHPDSTTTYIFDGINYVISQSTKLNSDANNDKPISTKVWEYDGIGFNHWMTLLYFYESYSGISTPKEKLSDITLYPNPTSTKLYLNWSNFESQKVQLRVTDILGRTLFTENRNWNMATLEVSLSGLAHGQYQLSVWGENGQKLAARTFVKQ